MPHQTLFNKLLIFVNLYQLIKNKAASSISSGEILDLKVLQSEWLRAFWSICLEHFSQIEDLYKNTVNTINFNSEQVPGKLMTQFLFKFKRTYFRPIFCPFPLFLGQKMFAKKSCTHKGFLVLCRNLEKPNDPIQRKQPNRQQFQNTVTRLVTPIFDLVHTKKF